MSEINEYKKFPTISKLTVLEKTIENKDRINEVNYQKACKLMVGDDIHSYQSAIVVFEELEDFKDSQLKIESCKNRIKEIENKQIPNKNNNKIAIVSSSIIIVALVFAFVIMQIIIPRNIGDVIQFGKYNGKEIEWIIVDQKEDSVLIASKDIVDEREYNKEYKDITWETCELRSWLNNDFINSAFTQEEKEMIMITNVINKDNDKYGTFGGNDTKDCLFLLSIDEVNIYFASDEERKANDGYWLRSPGLNATSAALVHNDGYVYEFGDYVDDTRGVRPACWIQIEYLKSSNLSE